MDLLTPDSGLLFWMLISFGIVVYILTKYGFPIIIKMVEERKAYIEESLVMAEKARFELERVKAEGEAIIDSARKEHLKIMTEAAELKQTLMEEAKVNASGVTVKMIEDARIQIMNEKEEAIREIRREVANLSVDIAEKILRSKLSEKDEQVQMIDRLLDEINISKS
jgi:F-type H+-transporting ATPase subunit b